MKSLLSDLAGIAGKGQVEFGAFDPTTLFEGSRYELAPEVREYFSNCVPTAELDLDFCRILGPAALRAENVDYLPSCFCAPHGFVTIASDMGGDAFSVDVTDGKVYQISHEKYESDEIQPGWNADQTAFLPPLPINRQNIIDTTEGGWESIAEFLQDCLHEATANG